MHIEGFSHLHLQGTGITDYGIIATMPIDGLSLEQTTRSGYRQEFSHDSERRADFMPFSCRAQMWSSPSQKGPGFTGMDLWRTTAIPTSSSIWGTDWAMAQSLKQMPPTWRLKRPGKAVFTMTVKCQSHFGCTFTSSLNNRLSAGAIGKTMPGLKKAFRFKMTLGFIRVFGFNFPK